MTDSVGLIPDPLTPDLLSKIHLLNIFAFDKGKVDNMDPVVKHPD